jgi:hypothetical protein
MKLTLRDCFHTVALKEGTTTALGRLLGPDTGSRILDRCTLGAHAWAGRAVQAGAERE